MTTTPDTRALLLWHPSMSTLAQSLLTALPTRLRASEVKWDKFNDQWPNIKFEHRSTMKNRDVVFLASFHEPAVLVEQISLMVAVARQGIKSFRIFVPYYACGTMERVQDDPLQKEQELATAETVFKMATSCLPCTAGGPPTITIFDIHALVERFYANDRATVILESALSLVLPRIIARKMTVIFPDEGAFKRFGSMFKGTCPIVVCSKVRGEGEQRAIAITQEFLEHSYGPGIDPMKQPGVIIDDLVQSGSTLATCALALRAVYTFSSLSAYVTHAIFPKEAHKQFLPGGKNAGVFDHFYVTNTNPTVTDVLAKVGAPFEVLDIAPLLVKSLWEDLKERDIPAPNKYQRRLEWEMWNISQNERHLYPSPPQITLADAISRVRAQKLPRLPETWQDSGDNDDLPALTESPRVPALEPVDSPVAPESSRLDIVRPGDVVLFSLSPVKKDAVLRAMERLGRNRSSIHCRKTPSGVPNQPIGHEEISRGASNRIDEAVVRANPTIPAISIESGIVETNKGSGEWLEMNCVVVRLGPNEGSSWIPGPLLRGEPYATLLPLVLVAKGKVTLGELLHKRDATVAADNWYDRVSVLAKCVEELLLNLK